MIRGGFIWAMLKIALVLLGFRRGFVMDIDVGFVHGFIGIQKTGKTGNAVIIRCSFWVTSDLSESVITQHGR